MDPYSKRIDIWNDTYKRQHNYPSIPSIKYSYKYLIDEIKGIDNPNHKTQIIIENIDTIDGAVNILAQNMKPLVLNMASAWTPGGGVRKGAGAQEETLFLRSNYDMTLEKKFYPLKLDEVIYSPNVVIFKDSDYDKIKPFTLDFIACAAIKDPKLMKMKYNQSNYDTMKNKIRMIFYTAILKKYDCLVVGAFGCGAYHNPPEEVIKIFNEVIDENKGRFKMIYFAVKSIKDGNYDIFKKGIIYE